MAYASSGHCPIVGDALAPDNVAMAIHLRNRWWRHPPGFTALELVIALAIAAILLVAGVPALRQFTMQQRMRAAVSTLHSSLVLARAEAIVRTGRTVACPHSDGGPCSPVGEWHTGWQIFQDLNDDREWQSAEPLLRRVRALDGLRILSSRHRTRLRFFPNGSAPGSNATIVFCDGRGPGAAYQLTVSPSGRIRRGPATASAAARCAV